jgi:hypothetical protein
VRPADAARKEYVMAKCNSRDSETTKEPLEQRKRTPHRSGQEYEYGEVPETGLGGAGGGADPNAQCARTSDSATGDTEDAPDAEQIARDSGGDRAPAQGFGARRSHDSGGNESREPSPQGFGSERSERRDHSATH